MICLKRKPLNEESRKSGAQTPAKPSERKKGSSKNKKGSAGKGGPSITFSAKVTQSLKNKVKEHNAKSKKKVTLSQLKKVYRRGAGAFSTSHRPSQSRGSWAMARVNMFLKMKRGGKRSLTETPMVIFNMKTTSINRGNCVCGV